MKKPRLNVVYANNNMPQPRIGPLADPGADLEVVWSREEEAGADVVLYWNSYTYRPQLTARNPGAMRILYIYEPVVVDPLVYDPKLWRNFDALLTWNDPLVAAGPPFHYMPLVYYDLAFHPNYGVEALPPAPEDVLSRPRSICQICGDKFSLVPCELYSLRRKAAEWFHQHGTMKMDVYGIPGMKAGNYVGPSDDKFETLSKYRYSLCFENTYHPVWSQGWVTEKIFDCMCSGTVPVYYGAPNIDQRVDEGTYIDYRDFSSFNELEAFLLEMSDETYLGYVERMRTFLEKHKPREQYACARLYQGIESLHADWKQHGRPAVTSWPKGYYESLASWNERLRYLAMWFALKQYRFVYPVFAVLRWLRWAGTKVSSVLRPGA
jgi:hypothetical protein